MSFGDKNTDWEVNLIIHMSFGDKNTVDVRNCRFLEVFL